MGHRPFGRKYPQTNITNQPTTSTIAREERMEGLNGLTKITDDQRRAVEETRVKIRDQVSKKMGDMLLRGYTMLDAYCNVCSGILMEKQGVRECVQCELLRQELNLNAGNGSVVVAEIPLDESNVIGEPEETMHEPEGRISYSPGQEISPIQQLRKQKEEFLKEFRTSRDLNSKAKTTENRSLGASTATPVSAKPGTKRQKQPPTASNSIMDAIEIVDEKLRWCTNALKKSGDLEQIILLQQAIKGSIEILNMCKHQKF